MSGFRLLDLLVLLCVLGSSSGGAPVVTVESYYVIQEEQPIGSELFSFTAVDPTAGHMLSVRGTSVITNQNIGFNITYVGGQSNNIKVKVVAKQRLDREEQSQFRLEFLVEDSIGNSVHRVVDLYLMDINDNAPNFQGLPYSWDIPELPVNSTASFKITATDLDDGNNARITYALKAKTKTDSTKEEYERMFKIDTHTGVVRFFGNLSYAENSYYQFTVVAMDSVHNTTADFIVRVLDVQNLPPFFIGIPYRVNIDENIPVNSPVKKIIATDGDTGNSNAVNYTIEASACSSLFNISVMDGQIYTAGEIDRDAAPLRGGWCVLHILVQEIDTMDQQYGNTSSRTDVTITVRDLNDNAPKFGNSTYIAQIEENAAMTTPITLIAPTQLTVADADDEVANTEMTLSLLYPNGLVCNDFEVAPSTVQKEGSVLIRVKNSDILDYETVTQITLIIVAKETQNSFHTDTATVTLAVMDMNDNSPQFHQDSYQFKVFEGTPNQTAGVLIATDEDSSFGPVVYILYGGNGRFTIDRLSGEVSTTCNNVMDCAVKLDRETANVYYMTVTATDNNGTFGGRSNSVSLVVKLLDINDNAPVFTRISPIRLFIEENDDQYINTSLVTVEARDIDEPGNINSDVWYSITSVSQGICNNVTINHTTGDLFLTHPVDFEKLTGSAATRTIEVVVSATDKGAPYLYSHITVLIEVQSKSHPDCTNRNGRR